MRIIFVANHYVHKNKAMQGFMSYLTRTTTVLSELGNEVIIVACGEHTRHFFEGNVEIYIEEFYNKNYHYKPLEILRNYILMSKVVNKRIKILCSRRNVDIIQFTSLSGLSLCYFGKIPAVMRLSSYAKIAYQTHQTLSEREERMISLLERAASKHCNAVFAPCENTARIFSKDIGRNVSVIESPFYNDVSKYNEGVYIHNLKGKKYVLFFGKLYAEKGILVIADMLYSFLQQNKEYYLVFCGDSESIKGINARKILMQSAKELSDRVIFFNSLPHDSLYYVIIKAEFVILPSLMENLSNACIEAMSFGKVVVGTDGASFEQLIVDGKNGLLCKPNDPQGLLKKMNEAVIMSNEQKEQMGALAKKRIHKLQPNIAVGKLLKYYQHVVKFANRTKGE